MLQLTLELAPALVPLRVERAGRERGANGAARLLPVRAVREAAFRDQRLNVIEGCFQPVIGVPELQLAQSRRIEHKPAARERDELAVRCGVPSAAVRLA